MRPLRKVTCLLVAVTQALLPACFEDHDKRAVLLDHYYKILWISPIRNAQVHIHRATWPPIRLNLSSLFLVSLWNYTTGRLIWKLLQCNTPLCLRVKLRLKEQEQWKTVFHSFCCLSFRDITTRARESSSSSSFSEFRNFLCAWKSCSVRQKDSSFLNVLRKWTFKLQHLELKY